MKHSFDNLEFPKEAYNYFVNTSLSDNLLTKYQDIWTFLDNDTKKSIKAIQGTDSYDTGDLQLSAIDQVFEDSNVVQEKYSRLTERRKQAELLSQSNTYVEQEKTHEDINAIATQLERLANLELVRVERNQLNNALIDKTVHDLRMSEYFHTGQEHYLKQQLAELMAKKF